MSISVCAQDATEIYLFDLIKKDSSFQLTNPINISNNKGYDNQPSFSADGNSILFSSERNGQTDIAKYEILENYRIWLTNTDASEFSPMVYPNKKKYFTCVRLNEDGSQLLYKYAFKNKDPEILIPQLKVGYYLWFNNKTIISFVLGDIETLQVSNFKYKIKYPIQSNIGRSLNLIPASYTKNKQLISFISKSHESPEIYAIDPLDSEIEYITDPLEGSEDLTWTPDGTILMGSNNKIFKLKPGIDQEWLAIDIESDLPLKNITRLVVSPSGSKIAVVVDE
ncbi:MAG: hypothetical protein OEM04_01850 [Flavobacteriaceae bacterium]|nr:hypothetical protein [Flavobacteriaceae bacterium]